MTLNTNGEQSVSGATVETVLPNFLFVLEVWENGPSFSHNLGKWSDTSPVCTAAPPSPVTPPLTRHRQSRCSFPCSLPILSPLGGQGDLQVHELEQVTLLLKSSSGYPTHVELTLVFRSKTLCDVVTSLSLSGPTSQATML